MTVIEFRTLGTLDLRRADGTELHSLLAQPKRVALLAYLCIAKPRGFHRRDTLLGLFWPDADQAHARASLRNALHVLRLSLGEDAVRSRGDEEVGINFDVVWCDAISFEQQIALNGVDALELYRGEFFAGFFLEEVPALERWLERERTRLRALAANASHQASVQRESEGNLTDALSFARREVELAQTDERAVRHLIRLLARAGDRAAALRTYEKFAKELATELEAEPSPETRALVEEVRRFRADAPSVVAPPANVVDLGVTPAPALESQHSLAAGPADTRPARVGSKRLTVSALAGLALVIAALSIGRAFGGGARADVALRHKLTATGNAMMGSLSPDGQFLAYVAQTGDSQRVLIQDVAGGTPNPIKTMRGAVWSLEWSPDGRRLLLGGFGRLMVLPRLGGQSGMMGPENGLQPMGFWLSDGRVSVHQAGDRRILVLDPKTQDTLSLPVKGGYLWLLEGSWSPTSRVFAVVTETGDPLSWEIRTVTFDGKSELLVKDTVLLGSPRWSLDGDYLYYARGADAIWRIAISPTTGVARGAPVKVLGDLEMYVQRGALLHFALTPDGTGLFYPKGARFSNLWLVERVEGPTQPRSISLTTGTSLRWSPVVSPDGSTVAFAQESDDGAELFTMPIAGGPSSQITSGARVHPEGHIAWSPDGSQIAFSTVRRGHVQVWVATVADGKLRAFPQTRAGISSGHLAWAPGSAIAYQNTDQTTINLIDPASGRERTVIRSPSDGFVYSPTYSPDGKRMAVVFSPGHSSPPDIYVLDVRTSAFTRVNGGGYTRGWSPDSRSIYFQLPQSAVIHRLASRGGQKDEVFLTPPFRAATCRPVGATRPNAFICAAFDFASDIWRIDNFDPNQK